MSKVITLQGLSRFLAKCKEYFQQKLVSGTNIKKVNNSSLLGNGNLKTTVEVKYYVDTFDDVLAAINSGAEVVCDYEGQSFLKLIYIETDGGTSDPYEIYFAGVNPWGNNGTTPEILCVYVDTDDLWHDDDSVLLQKKRIVSSWQSTPDNAHYPSEKLVYDSINPAVGVSQPAGGMLPNVPYDLGTLSGSVTIVFASPSDANVMNHYFFMFDTSGSAPTITFPASITSWVGGSAPTINANKHYEVSVINGVGITMEV